MSNCDYFYRQYFQMYKEREMLLSERREVLSIQFLCDRCQPIRMWTCGGSGYGYGVIIISHSSFEVTSGGYCSGVPPLPIPNREVKPACADGTAMQCGRVGGRPLFSEALERFLRAFLFLPFKCIFFLLIA